MVALAPTRGREMRDLRLIGVQDDGEHVILADADGTRFRLPLDEALRAAARQDRPRLGAQESERGGLRPRDVQELIRSGLSREEVAERSGWTVEKVRRFETPVLAERDHVARLARATPPGGGVDIAETLGDRVHARLRDRGVSPERTAWDSARAANGVWTVTVTFPAGGQQRTARWRFDPGSRYLRALNDDARWLGEDDSPESVIPTPHVVTPGGATDTVYDLEVEGGLDHEAVHATEDDLTDAVRAHTRSRGKGRRRTHRAPTSPSHAPGSDEQRADALPLEGLAIPVEELGPPPDRPRVDEVAPATGGRASGDQPPSTDDAAPTELPLATGPSAAAEPPIATEPPLATGPSPAAELRPTADPGAPERSAGSKEAAADPDPAAAPDPAGTPDPAAAPDPAGTPDPAAAPDPASGAPETGGSKRAPATRPQKTPKRTASKKARTQVPSWDDVILGTKPAGRS